MQCRKISGMRVYRTPCKVYEYSATSQAQVKLEKNPSRVFQGEKCSFMSLWFHGKSKLTLPSVICGEKLCTTVFSKVLAVLYLQRSTFLDTKVVKQQQIWLLWNPSLLWWNSSFTLRWTRQQTLQKLLLIQHMLDDGTETRSNIRCLSCCMWKLLFTIEECFHRLETCHASHP